MVRERILSEWRDPKATPSISLREPHTASTIANHSALKFYIISRDIIIIIVVFSVCILNNLTFDHELELAAGPMKCLVNGDGQRTFYESAYRRSPCNDWFYQQNKHFDSFIKRSTPPPPVPPLSPA